MCHIRAITISRTLIRRNNESIKTSRTKSWTSTWKSRFTGFAGSPLSSNRRATRLRKATGLRTVYPRPRFSTSEPHPDHEVYPYLLKDLKIDHSNQVWATDITYTKVSGCKAFVIAIIDLYSRKTLSYNVVNTMDTYSCVETLLLAMTRYGIPEIFNSDQGSQFTSKEFTDELKAYGIRQHGWPGKMPGQCQDGTVLVGAEVRGPQNQRVQIPASTTQRRPKLCKLLQRKTASFRPELPNPGRGLRERTP